MKHLLLYILLLFTFTVVVHADSIGLDYSLKAKKLSGRYSKDAIALEQIIVDIHRVSGHNAAEKVNRFFKNGEQLWYKIKKSNSYQVSITFTYKQLCDAVIQHYLKTNQTYKTISIYQKLIKESRDSSVVDVELESLGKLSDIYLSLGLLDSANDTLMELQEAIEDYFFLDIENIEDNLGYDVVVNSEYQKNRLRYLLLQEGIEPDLISVQKQFDFELKYYAYNYLTPFMQLTGMLNTETAFAAFSKDIVANRHYYTNFDLMYYYAQFFARNNDKVRAELALVESLKALKSNGSGSTSAISFADTNSIAAKENHANIGQIRELNEPIVLERIPLKFAYLSALYSAHIYLELGLLDKTQIGINTAKQQFSNLMNHYEKLPKEYKVLDGILDTKRQLLTIQARLLEEKHQNLESLPVYQELIQWNEDVRSSLPVKLRKGFFTGYAKDAYLGLIRVTAKIYEQKKSLETFNHFLTAINQMNSRQLKDLNKTSKAESVTLDAIQASLVAKDLIYIIFDVQTNIIAAGISKTDVQLSVLPRRSNIDTEFHEIKNDLVKFQRYDQARFAKVSSSFIEPILFFKKAKNIHVLIDGVMSILPLDIYPLNGQMLFNQYNIDYLTTLAPLKAKNNVSSNFTLLAIADPQYNKTVINTVTEVSFSKQRSVDISGYFEQLPETRKEVETIARTMKSSTLLLGQDAKESKVKSISLKPFDYIHFATHGILGGEIPDANDPALVLSHEDGEDALLTSTEISKLKLNARLVVLSACNTGSGQYFRGEGITGIARAFKIAGANDIVASLWPVDSFATEKLMGYFYEFISKGYSSADALYSAKQKLQQQEISKQNNERSLVKKGLSKGNYVDNQIEGYANPYFWSPFILLTQ